MSNKAIISVMSEDIIEKDNKIELMTLGTFFKKEEKYYVVYDETEISGMKGTKTTFKISPDKFSLIRMGTTNAKMEFELNSESMSLYNTPYGVIEIKIKTNVLDINVSDNGGDVMIIYDMTIGNEKIQSTLLKVNIKIGTHL
jgi:uncharacterized beta-barrel protein YwiB (DUF1934 family)